jgi:hypothetical protein
MRTIKQGEILVVRHDTRTAARRFGNKAAVADVFPAGFTAMSAVVAEAFVFARVFHVGTRRLPVFTIGRAANCAAELCTMRAGQQSARLTLAAELLPFVGLADNALGRDGQVHISIAHFARIGTLCLLLWHSWATAGHVSWLGRLRIMVSNNFYYTSNVPSTRTENTGSVARDLCGTPSSCSMRLAWSVRVWLSNWCSPSPRASPEK